MDYLTPQRKEMKLWSTDKYIWGTLAFALAYIPVAVWRHLLTAPAWTLWVLIAAATVNGIIRTYRGWHWIHTVFDIGFLAAAIGITSGLESDLWLLYFVATISESLYASSKRVLIVLSSIIVTYILATLPHQIGIAPLPWAEYIFILGSRLFFLFMVGTYGRRISFNAEERNRELLLLREQLATGEERARIAREVHDGLGHAIVSIILRLELCLRLMRRAPDEAEEILKEEIPAIRAAWSQGRDLAFHLRPWESEIGEKGQFIDSLRQLIGRFAERTGIQITFKTEGETDNISAAQAFGLTRIIQEALTNAAKHAEASAIEISLARTTKRVIDLCISDNGKGFDRTLLQTGFGLQAMEERVNALNGTFHLESQTGVGTKLMVSLP